MTESEFKEWFESTLVKGDNGCLNWIRATDTSGYGRLNNLSKKLVSAPRLALEYKLGRPIGSGMCVRHKCDNRRCCNQDHIEEGTQKDNMADMVSRNRKVTVKGENSPRAKLTDIDIKTIRDLKDTVSQKELSERYHVSQSYISRLVRNVQRIH